MKFCHSTDGERFFSEEGTREEVIQVALDGDVVVGSVVFSGVQGAPLDADDVAHFDGHEYDVEDIHEHRVTRIHNTHSKTSIYYTTLTDRTERVARWQSVEAWAAEASDA